jgi:adenosylcobinamide kinase/adenosylcobinamide-phosphate guanylyltransferase
MKMKSEPTITFVIGGARSGKSSHAESLAVQYSGKRIYLATAEPFDDEMRERIARHQEARRGKFLSTVEEPLHLARALSSVDDDASIVLVDCLTVWMGNLLHHKGSLPSYGEVEQFMQYLEAPKNPLILVSNEVGQGIVPGDPMSRHFRDHAGWLNQSVAQIADRVIWMVAGIPVTIKGEATI